MTRIIHADFDLLTLYYPRGQTFTVALKSFEFMIKLNKIPSEKVTSEHFYESNTAQATKESSRIEHQFEIPSKVIIQRSAR